MMRERLQAWADYLAGIGIALLAAAGILKLLNQPNERIVALVVLGVIGLVFYVFAKPAQVRQAVTGRGVRYGANALLMSLAFIGIVGGLNFLAARYHQRVDLTANKSQSLSPLTIQVLKDLKQPVKATAFYTTLGGQIPSDVEDRLKEFANQTDNFTYRVVDPQANPQIAQDYKVQFDGTIVLERGTRRENVLQTDEQGLANALLKVSQDTQPAIYFTTGHGEHSPDDTGDNGYGSIKAAMETENYKVEVLNLKTVTDTLPSDISALIIAGPRQKLDPEEVKHVKDYLDKNGRVLLMLDPQADAGLDEILKAWGLNLRNDIVIDPKFGLFGRAQIPVVSNYKSHTITQDLAGLNTFFPGARSLSVDTTPPSGRFASALFATSDASWGETNFDSIKNQNPQFDPNTDAKGPLDLAYAVEGSGDKPARLVVIGNSSFVTAGTLRSIQGGANALLFGNSLHWLASQENLIAIPPKPQAQNSIFLTGEQSIFVALSTVVLLPGAILLIGAWVWWRRR